MIFIFWLAQEIHHGAQMLVDMFHVFAETSLLWFPSPKTRIKGENSEFLQVPVTIRRRCLRLKIGKNASAMMYEGRYPVIWLNFNDGV